MGWLQDGHFDGIGSLGGRDEGCHEAVKNLLTKSATFYIISFLCCKRSDAKAVEFGGLDSAVGANVL